MRHPSSKLLLAGLIFSAATPVWAQPATEKSSFRAGNVQIVNDPPGIRATGNVIIQLPELGVRADALDYDGSNLQEFTEIRARGAVDLRISPRPKNSADQPFQVRSKSDKATLTRATRKLVLEGNLSGFYRVGNGPQTLLTGNKATFNFATGGLNALLEGEPGQQIELLLPAETGKSDALGPIRVRSDELRIDQANNAAYFSGKARAVSESGANKIDVSAPSFTLISASNGAIGTLTTNGKTLTKLDIAPNPNADPKANILTYVELTADKATVNRVTSTGSFEGNVKGFYRLQNSPEKFDFSGQLVTVNYDEKAAKTGSGLSVFADGSPFDIKFPDFDLGF